MNARGICIVFAAVALLAVPARGADVATISRGERVDLEDHLAEGKYVLFDFYADWCMPCRQLAPRLEEYAAQNEATLALRKIDVIKWSSAVAKQFRITSLPHLRLYDPNGHLLAQGGADVVLGELARAMGDDGIGSTAGRPSLMPLLIFAAVAGLVLYLFSRGRSSPQ